MYAIMEDNKFTEEEKELLSVYCRELNIEEKLPDTDIDLNVLIQDVKVGASIENLSSQSYR